MLMLAPLVEFRVLLTPWGRRASLMALAGAQHWQYLALTQMVTALLLPLAAPHQNTAAHIHMQECTGSAIAPQHPPPPLLPQGQKVRYLKNCKCLKQYQLQQLPT